MNAKKTVSQNKLFSGKLNFQYSIAAILVVVLIAFWGCKKEGEPDFSADFSYEIQEGNYVVFKNESQGEYYSLIWNFGNGDSDTTTDKRRIYAKYFPQAGDFQASLKLANYYGSTNSTSKTINITTTDLQVSFTAEIDQTNPNYVNLTNTSQGTYEAFKWVYQDIEVLDSLEHRAYFPLAGNYEVELVVKKNNDDHSQMQNVIITQDDPNNIPNIVWYDEFGYTGLPDPAKWNMEIGGDGWGNNELQYYTNSESNAYADNGILTITAKEEYYSGNDYTSARITTQNKYDFKYGRIEARIRLPYGQGMWPAFWMLGANHNTVGWPDCGEIDIMEMVGGEVAGGGDNVVHSTIHWDDNGEDASYGQSYTLPSGILADDFHVYAVEWNEQEIRGYIDNIHYYTADITPAGLSEFHSNFFIILNVAVGGTWPGLPNAETSFPQTMEVDYIRVFQDEEK